MRLAKLIILITLILVPVIGIQGRADANAGVAFPYGGESGAVALEGITSGIAVEQGRIVNFNESLVAAGNYLKMMQADVTEDNAGNGDPDSPDDPDDGGWDWVITSPPDPFSHSVNPSPTNIYGATALGLYYAYLKSNDTSYFIAMNDAADNMVINPNIKSAADLIFLVLYNDLLGASTTIYMDSAKSRFDARIASYGSATELADSIRDVRAFQGYPNGIIAWDLGQFVRAAVLLHGKYPSDPYDYAQAAVDIAEVLWEDSFNDNPGYFDVVDDAGYDPSGNDKNFWWYNLGITGLIDAFSLSGVHIDEIPGLVTILLDGQYNNGAISYSYGANIDDENWQSTAFSAMTLGRLDQSTYQDEINWMAYWLGATQDTSGGWRYYTSTNNHYPEIAGECARGISYASSNLTYVIVDDDFTDQTDVDIYNAAHGTNYVWGYDAFAVIQDGVDAINSGTVFVFHGTYSLPINFENKDNISILGESKLGTIFKPMTTINWDVGSYGSSRQTAIRVVNSTDIAYQNFTLDFDLIKGNNVSGLLYWNSSGEISYNTLQNMNAYDAGGGYYELTCYLRAPDMTDSTRAHIDILNNSFLKTGRLAVVTHDFVDVLIDGNEFDKIDEDFGYALEIGSMSTAIITNNTFRNFATWAATDFSIAAAIYVENSYTSQIIDPISKSVVIENNDIAYCQYGLYIGNSWPDGAPAAGNVDINCLIKNNTIHDASTSGSWSSGGVVLTDQGRDAGSSVTALLDSNSINNNANYGLYIFTDGNGEITATATENKFNNNMIGIQVSTWGPATSVYDLTIYDNFLDNSVNAYNTAVPGYWDDGISTGNCWSDFQDNSGYPYQYNVLGTAGAVDRYPNLNCPCDCAPGDANGSAPINIFDITRLIDYLYREGNPPLPYDTCSGDPNCDCTVNIFDITYIIDFLYRSGPEPCDCASWLSNCGWPPTIEPQNNNSESKQDKLSIEKSDRIESYR